MVYSTEMEEKNIKIKHCPSLASFKTNLKKHILDQYDSSTIDTKYAPTS